MMVGFLNFLLGGTNAVMFFGLSHIILCTLEITPSWRFGAKVMIVSFISSIALMYAVEVAKRLP